MLIKNGFLIDPATKKSGNYDIRIKNGIITEIENTLSPAPNEQVTDAAGLTVAPGLIDARRRNDRHGSVENCRSMRIYRRWHSVEKRRVFIRGNGKIQTAKRTDQPS